MSGEPRQRVFPANWIFFLVSGLGENQGILQEEILPPLEYISKAVGKDKEYLIHISSGLLSTFHALTSASRLTLCPRILPKIAFARCGLSCSASHFGLSGTKRSPAKCKTPIPPAAARIVLQRSSLLRKYPRNCAMKMPKLIITCVKAPKNPFPFGGANSDM